MEYLEIKAPAKINIGLNVVSKREDGYHNIETVFYPLKDIYDELYFTRDNQFSFICNDPGLASMNNLIIRAKNLLEQQSNIKFNVKIELKKKIPTGAGLGGGSSDAAATLLSLNEMFELKFSMEQLKEFALQLGSDVPFFIKPKPSFAESRGEILTLIDLDIPEPILIVNPGIHLSTKEAYGNIKPKATFNNLKELKKNDLNCHSNVKNDFEDYVFEKYPEIKRIKEILYEAGAFFALMSGSGSTVYGIFNRIEDAEQVRGLFPNYITFVNVDD